MVTIKKFVLPNPVDFLRAVAEAILLNLVGDRETNVGTPPLVTKAKTLTSGRGLVVMSMEKEE